jgi:hypothetical protein
MIPSGVVVYVPDAICVFVPSLVRVTNCPFVKAEVKPLASVHSPSTEFVAGGATAIGRCCGPDETQAARVAAAPTRTRPVLIFIRLLPANRRGGHPPSSRKTWRASAMMARLGAAGGGIYTASVTKMPALRRALSKSCEDDFQRTRTFLNCQGSLVSISSGKRPGRPSSGVQSV